MGTTGRLWTAAGALCLGAVVAGEWHAAYCAVPAAAGALCVYRRSAALRIAGVVALGFAGGWLSAAARAGPPQPVELLARSVPRCSFEGVVGETGSLGSMVAVEELRCSAIRARSPGTVVVDGVLGDPGSRVRGEGWLVPLGETGFDAVRKRSGADAFFDLDAQRVEPPTDGVAAIAARARHGLRNATAGTGERGALLRGLTIGDTSDLSRNTIDAFRSAGLSHLVAVSGSNVAIVLGAVALGVRRLPHAARLGISLASLAMFVVVVGTEPSVLRAAAMGSIALVALAWGRRALPLNTLALAVAAVIALRPDMVRSAGLHLSVAATAGIVLWAPGLAAKMGPIPRWASLPLAATLAAQAAVAPVSIATFGQISIVGPLANAVAIPAVPPATVAGFLAGLSGLAHLPTGTPLAETGSFFAGWILDVAERLGHLPWASVEVDRGWAWTGLALAILGIARAVGRPSSADRV